MYSIYIIVAVVAFVLGIVLHKLYQKIFKTLGVLEVRHNSYTPDTDEYSMILNSDIINDTKNYLILSIKHINYTREINRDYNEE